MRWWSKFRGGLKKLALNPEGGVRAVWKLLLAYALYAVWAFLSAALLAGGFSALFQAWNLNANTLSRAPGWAQILVKQHGKLISLVGTLGAVALSRALLFWYAKKRPARLRLRELGYGALMGGLIVAVGAGLFLLTDSMRLTERYMSPSWDMLFMLPVYYSAALAEERFARTLALHCASRPAWGYAASTVLFLAVTGGWALGYIGALNMLLTGLICARWSAKGHAGASVGFRFVWSYVSGMVLAFPGGATGARPLVSLYSVSENWLTGGEGGLIRGAYMALMLLAVGAWYFRRPRGSA